MEEDLVGVPIVKGDPCLTKTRVVVPAALKFAWGSHSILADVDEAWVKVAEVTGFPVTSVQLFPTRIPSIPARGVLAACLSPKASIPSGSVPEATWDTKAAGMV